MRRVVNAVCVFFALLSVASFASYTARLYFENLTRGTSNAGQLDAYHGDLIAIHFTFTSSGTTNNKWGYLQVTLCSQDGPGGILFGSPEAANWVTQWTANAIPASHFLVKVFYGPGTLYDNALAPDDDTQTKLCDWGVYAGLGVNGSSTSAKAYDKVLFTFTASGATGSILNWSLDNRATATGLSTRLNDGAGRWVDITDNYVRFVGPAPTMTTVTASPNPANAGEAVTLSAVVTPVPDGGSVEYKDNGTPLGTAPVGQSLSVSFSQPGLHFIEAYYSGNSNYLQSNGWTSLEIAGWAENPTNRHQYRLTTASMTWDQARRQAVLWGGTLVSLQDAAERNWLSQTFGNDEDFHIGLRDIAWPLGKWRWETGEAVNYTDWDAGQPSSDANAFAVIAAKNSAGKWKNVPIAAPARGIVERVPPVKEELSIPATGATITTSPLLAGKRYVIEASGQWAFGKDGSEADAEFSKAPGDTWLENRDPNDELELTVDGQKIDWLGSADGVHYAPHTYSPSHVYRTVVTGTGAALSLRIDDAILPTDDFGGLSVVIYSPVPTVGTQADSPWPLANADPQTTGHQPWAIGPDAYNLAWSLPGAGIPMAVAANGDIYCAKGGVLQRISSAGALLGQITLGAGAITGMAIGIDGAVYAVCANESVSAVTANLAPIWQQAGGGFCGLLMDEDGNLYYGGWYGDGTVFSRDSSGNPRWSLNLGSNLRRGISMGTDGNLYFASSNSNLVYVVSRSGALLSVVDSGRHGPLPPTFGPDGTMYLEPDDGIFQCFNPDFSLRWEAITDGGYGAPTVLPNGRVVSAAFLDTSLFSFDPDGTLLWEMPEYSMSDERVRSDALGSASHVNWSRTLWSVNYLGTPVFSNTFPGTDLPQSHIIGKNGTMYLNAGGTLYAVGPGTPAMQETLVLAAGAYVTAGSSTTLSGRLALGRNAGGLSGKTLHFFVDDVEVGTAVTDWRGIATLDYPTTLATPVGARVLRLEFFGDAQAWGSSGEADLWVAAAPATLRGQVLLELWFASPAGVPIEFTAYDGSTVVGTTSALLNASGDYSISLQIQGSYRVQAKGPHWLSQSQEAIVFDPSTPAIRSFGLPNGDCNDDNLVGLVDLNRVIVNFATPGDSSSDLNGSGFVDLHDMNVVFINFGRTGT